MASASECAALLADVTPAVMDVLRDGARAARRSDLTLPQLRCLGYLERHAGASLSEVAAHVGLSAPAMSQVVDGLVARRLLRRDAATDDRRRVRLSATAAGRAQVRDAKAGARAGLSRLVARLAPGDVAKLHDALATLQAALVPEARA